MGFLIAALVVAVNWKEMLAEQKIIYVLIFLR